MAQPRPDRLRQAFILGGDFIGHGPVCLTLGDSVFYDNKLSTVVQAAVRLTEGFTVFAYPVKDPERYGIVELDSGGRVLNVEEKPRKPSSNLAVTAVYFCDRSAVEIAPSPQPSDRGELEVLNLLREYRQRGSLTVRALRRGIA